MRRGRQHLLQHKRDAGQRAPEISALDIETALLCTLATISMELILKKFRGLVFLFCRCRCSDGRPPAAVIHVCALRHRATVLVLVIAGKQGNKLEGGRGQCDLFGLFLKDHGDKFCFKK